MFKSIKNTLQRRQESLGRNENISDITQQAILSYLEQNYSDTSARISVRYQESDNVLVIVTQNKTLAGELSLHASELTAYLASRNIRVSRIIVR